MISKNISTHDTYAMFRGILFSMGFFILFAGPLLGKLTYTLSFEDRGEHYVTVELDIDGLKAEEFIEIKMPVWTPGSYKIREFSRNIIDLTATVGRAELAVEKLNKNTWRIALQGRRRITIRYQVYAFEVSVRTSYVDNDFAMLNGASIFVYPVGMTNQESLVVISLPRSWQQATSSLTRVGGRSPVFRAINYDILIDSPIMLGRQQVIDFEVSGVPHRYAISGDGNYNQGRLVEDSQLIIESIHDLYGSIPYQDYTIFLQIRDNQKGALEHLNSMHIMYQRWNFDSENYYNYLFTFAHEVFHAYNVKRIRPTPLGPFDYEKENYTTLLWVSEGFTDYYERLLVRRVDLISTEKYLSLLGDDIQLLNATPGRLHQTLREASFDTWIKHYRPNENSPNTTISYYHKGRMVGLLFDLAIRAATNGERSLDNVFKILWQGYKDTGNGFSEEDFRAICESVAGRPLDDVYRYVTTTDEIEWETHLAPFGLRVDYTYKAPEDAESVIFGIEKGLPNGRMVIGRVDQDSPAAKGGLSVRDEILAVDDYRLTEKNALNILKTRSPKKLATFLVNRDGKIKTLRVRPAELPYNKVNVEQVENPTDSQRQLFEAWLSTTWD